MTTKTIALETLTCGTCGVLFALAESFIADRRKDHAWWYCPNGHQWHYTQENETERLKRELEATRDNLARARKREASAQRMREAAENSLRATKGHLTRVKRRIEAGVCIHCNRTFQDVARHMESKHREVSYRRPIGTRGDKPKESDNV